MPSAYQGRDGGIKAQPASDRRQGETQQHRARGPHVRHDVLAAHDQSGGLQATAAADQHQRPGQVDRPGHAVERNAEERDFRRVRVLPALPSRTRDRERRHQHGCALDDSAEVLGLLVPVGMVGVGGLLAEP